MNSKVASFMVSFVCVLAALLSAGSAHAANPFGLSYKGVTNVSTYGRATGILITGRCNTYDPAFAAARSRGAEILMYLNPVDRPDHYNCALDQRFFMGNYGAVPLWPYPTYGQRSIYPNFRMTDMRPGSAWILHVVSYISQLMRENRVDGVFLDVVGARPWSRISEWTTWSQAEKNAWTDGNIDLVRRLDAARRSIRPSFIIVNNNVWDRGDTRGLPGERYVDGIVLEHPAFPASQYHRNYLAKPFGNLGHRRVLVIGRDAAQARVWATYPGVTHVSSQMTYGTVTPPPVPFSTLNDR